MESPLTPDLALAYLRELSTDLTGAIIMDADGQPLAGAAALAAPARALLEAPEAAAGLTIRTARGWVLGLRSRTVGIVVATGPRALAGLVRHDLAELAALLDGGPLDSSSESALASSTDVLQGLADAVQNALPAVATLSSADR
jgi:hypothetical protein